MPSVRWGEHTNTVESLDIDSDSQLDETPRAHAPTPAMQHSHRETHTEISPTKVKAKFMPIITREASLVAQPTPVRAKQILQQEQQQQLHHAFQQVSSEHEENTVRLKFYSFCVTLLHVLNLNSDSLQ
jgi:hypothetical protein